VVFCDFDGTITAVETFEAMLEHFAPEASQRLLPEIYALRTTLREGVRAIIETIPSQRYGEMVAHVKQASLRPGLEPLLDDLDRWGVDFVVVSGGLRGMVEAALGPLVARVKGIHAMEVDLAAPTMRVSSPFEQGSEIVAKVEVMKRYPADETVAIGDSVTDVNMALHASLVFARDRLCDYLRQHQRDFLRWNDFFDVRDALARRFSWVE
jgi:2-hydroxy-3-keto-5-methylthiopentenyl-1-phosphate phosphatase